MNKLAVTLQQLEQVAKAWSIRKFNPKTLGRKAPRGFVKPLIKRTNSPLAQQFAQLSDPRTSKDIRTKLIQKLEGKALPPTKLAKPNEHVIYINKDQKAFGKTHQVQRVQRAITTHHENAERRYLASPLRSRAFEEKFHHASPAVVLNEHNIVTTLPSNTHRIDDIRKVRAHKRYNKELKDVVLDPDFVPGKSPRFSRHAIKRLTEDYIRRNP